jgi:rod shape-determining protein MreC
LLIGVLLIYPFATFLASGRKAREPNFVDRVVLGITSPMQKALSWTLDGVGSAWEGYVALRGVEKENLELKAENQKLRADLNQLGEARAENERLKRMLSYSQSSPDPQIPARVLGVNPVATLLSLRIDRGEADGVRRGMPVVTPDGVVGHIHRVTGGYADVVLITDSNSKVGVKVQRSRARATASGGGGNRLLQLENALRTDDVEEGDVIVTSGTDGIYPSGLVVGRVSSVQRKSYGMFQGAEVVPAVNMTKLEEVLVLAHTAGVR